MSPVELETKKHCAGEAQLQFSSQSVSYSHEEFRDSRHPVRT
jgi:hypothetical protein